MIANAYTRLTFCNLYANHHATMPVTVSSKLNGDGRWVWVFGSEAAFSDKFRYFHLLTFERFERE